MSISVFRKHWDEEHGYTMREAELKKSKVDEAHGVGSAKSKWQPAKIVPDYEKKDGFMVTIETIPEN